MGFMRNPLSLVSPTAALASSVFKKKKPEKSLVTSHGSMSGTSMASSGRQLY